MPRKRQAVPPTIERLNERIDQCMIRDRHRLRGELRRRRSGGSGRPGSRAGGGGDLERLFEKSIRRRQERVKRCPGVHYRGLDLPILAHRDEIAAAIRDHAVVIVCGETGSGKTTQLPKICLELGRGIAGMIGHTQPRRIAARSVAQRLADELGTMLGRAVGYKVRFGDRTSDDTYIKVMTDGILLAETQSDRFLDEYDTIIIDEAHERSLNIDFLLGYLKRLLAKRRDLKVIITSATIDPQRFSEHFNGAPIIEVSGRTYPVEVRHRPLKTADPDDTERDQVEAICAAVDELMSAGHAPGDILVFLSGERDIRETAQALRKKRLAHTEILPLYARLSAAEQQRVFSPHAGRRIVLATNVAETSLTVPGIRYVIDPGEARISRYSARSGVQRLPIEKISKASADQRKGRCGRLGPGVCLRLYRQEDYQQREAHTPPEIFRTNLAGVILQMMALGLGRVEEFPFIEAPKASMIRAGYQTLLELGAVDEEWRLTDVGRELARLPIDPRIGRMVLAGREGNCLHEILIIASALSCQDPRERPLERQDAADEAHVRLRDESSDFLSMLRLWDFYHERKATLSASQLRRCCGQNFLSFVRMREWCDLHRQLADIARQCRMPVNTQPAEPDAIHRALLSGLLAHIGLKTDQFEYTGAGGIKFQIFPGSARFRTPPAWIMAAELAETTRLYARTVAPIQPAWIEPLAGPLLTRSHFEPHWDRAAAHVMAYERVSLYGLEIVARRRVHFGAIDPAKAREIFIQAALVEGEYDTDAPFWRHNWKLIEHIETLEAKGRKRDVLVEEQLRYAFYDQRIPPAPQVIDGPTFEKWRRGAERHHPRLLFMDLADLMVHGAEDITQQKFPDHLEVDGVRLPLAYHLEPGHEADGVTMRVPVELFNRLDPRKLEWLVPGLLAEKITELIRGLPKAYRRNFVPAPDYAEAVAARLPFGEGELTEAAGRVLRELTGVEVPREAWNPGALPAHLRMNFDVVDSDDRVLAWGRDRAELRLKLGRALGEAGAGEAATSLPTGKFTAWEFGDLPATIAVERAGHLLAAYPAVCDVGTGVSLRAFDSESAARRAMRGGLRRLFWLAVRDELAFQMKSLPGINELRLKYAVIGSAKALEDDLQLLIVERTFLADDAGESTGGRGRGRGRESFERRLNERWSGLFSAALDTARRVGDILNLHVEARRALDGEVPGAWAAASEDMREQLTHLIGPGFLIDTPWDRLIHFPRYLKAILVRIEKLPGGGHVRDAGHMQRVRALWSDYRQRQAKHDAESVYDETLNEFRWMLEELRVSLFAQSLGTAQPVSFKRLEKLWQQVRG